MMKSKEMTSPPDRADGQKRTDRWVSHSLAHSKDSTTQPSGASPNPVEMFQKRYKTYRQRGYFKHEACKMALVDIGVNRIFKYKPPYWYKKHNNLWQRIEDDEILTFLDDLFTADDEPDPPATAEFEEKLLKSLQTSSFFKVNPAPVENKTGQEVYLIPCRNGVIKVKQDDGIWHAELREYKEEDFFPWCVQASYNPDLSLDGSRWQKFLDEVIPHYGQQHLLQQFAGTILVPNLNHQKAMFLYGVGRNGKSVVLNVLSEVIGWENVGTMRIDQLGRRFALGSLVDKIAILGSEVSATNFIETAIFKNMVAHDSLYVEQKYKQGKNMVLPLKLMFAVNVLPRVRDKSEGYLDRLLVVYFPRIIPPEKRIHNLAQQLAEERDIVLFWMIEGLVSYLNEDENWDREGLARSDEILADYAGEINHVVRWCLDHLVAKPEATVDEKPLYEEYRAWCHEEGVQPETRPNWKRDVFNFFEQKYSIKLERKRRYGGEYYWRGVGRRIL